MSENEAQAFVAEKHPELFRRRAALIVQVGTKNREIQNLIQGQIDIKRQVDKIDDDMALLKAYYYAGVYNNPPVPLRERTIEKVIEAERALEGIYPEMFERRRNLVVEFNALKRQSIDEMQFRADLLFQLEWANDDVEKALGEEFIIIYHER